MFCDNFYNNKKGKMSTLRILFLSKNFNIFSMSIIHLPDLKLGFVRPWSRGYELGRRSHGDLSGRFCRQVGDADSGGRRSLRAVGRVRRDKLIRRDIVSFEYK